MAKKTEMAIKDPDEDENEDSDDSPDDELDREEPSDDLPARRPSGRAFGPGPVRPGRSLPGKMTRSQAMKRLNCSKSKLDNLVSRNLLEPPIKDSDGRWWYSIEAVEELVEDDVTTEMSGASLLKAASEIIGQQYRHHDEMMARENMMMESFLSATHKILALQTEAATKSLERANKLEVELDEARETIGKAMNMNNQNEIQMAEAAARQKRNDRIAESFMPHLPTVVGMMAKHFAGKFGASTSQPQTGMDPNLKELVSSITPEQASKLMDSGVLTSTQMGQLFALWEMVKAAEEAEKKVAETVTAAAKGEVPKVESPLVEAK